MKMTQSFINSTYPILGGISYAGVAPSDIAKVMRLRKAMRPYFDAYKAFDEEVRRAQEHFDRLAEIELKGKEASEEDKAFFAEHIPAFIKAVNIAIEPELAKEYEIDVEPISEEAISTIVANNKGLTLLMFDFIAE